jgi:hypothetical protein
MKSLAIDLISIDGGTQFRASTNDAKVTEYAELLASATDWPFDTPCDVFFDGVNYYLVDGFHRYLGAQRANRASLSCNIHKGSLRDAIAFALKANARHGLHRTNEDKRKAVSFVLADAEWSKLSSRAIAEMCGVSDMFVGNLRKESGANGLHLTPERVGKDGKSYPARQSDSGANGLHLNEANKPEPDWLDVEDDEPIEAEQASPPANPPKEIEQIKEHPNGLAAPIQAVATRLDVMLKDLAVLREQCGGQWLDMTTIDTQAKLLKATIRGAAYWVDCPDCKGKGCKTCRYHGFLSRDRKPFLTQHQKDVLGV